MSCAEVLFAISSIAFTITTALPIFLFAYRPDMTPPLRTALLWIYAPPVIAGLMAFFSGLFSLGYLLVSTSFQLPQAFAPIGGILSLIALAVLIPKAVLIANQLLVERATEDIYEASIRMGDHEMDLGPKL